MDDGGEDRAANSASSRNDHHCPTWVVVTPLYALNLPDKFDFDELLSGSEDRAELEVMREKYDTLNIQSDATKHAHQQMQVI